MNTKIIVPIISAETIELALQAIDCEEHSLVYNFNWDPSMSEYLASLHVAKQELDAYAKQMTDNFGSVYGSTSDRRTNTPMNTSQFSLEVKKMLRELYGEYLPIIQSDAKKANQEVTSQ
jgi:hypothetical protein